MLNQTVKALAKPYPQDIEVGAFLASIGVQYFTLKHTQIHKPQVKTDWECDKWSIGFISKAGECSQFEYKTGIGNRVVNASRSLAKAYIKTGIAGKLLHSTGESYYPKGGGFSKSVHAVTPTPASVLYCLVLDSQAASESFNDWCDNFGYDNDSMKDFRLYQACCDNASKLNKVFTRQQLDTISELLEDY
jgi:hypothetical protein